MQQITKQHDKWVYNWGAHQYSAQKPTITWLERWQFIQPTLGCGRGNVNQNTKYSSGYSLKTNSTPNPCSSEETWSWIHICVKTVYSRKKRPLHMFS